MRVISYKHRCTGASVSLRGLKRASQNVCRRVVAPFALESLGRRCGTLSSKVNLRSDLMESARASSCASVSKD